MERSLEWWFQRFSVSLLHFLWIFFLCKSTFFTARYLSKFPSLGPRVQRGGTFYLGLSQTALTSMINHDNANLNNSA